MLSISNTRTISTEGTEVHKPHKIKKENSVALFFPSLSFPLSRLGGGD